ncbi:hypothetical protein [Lysobacter sp. N42]|uniref:hypothetical protein n=1 Tax=Lysobacter sp. N42 TaxID=2545719 RepID=UPI0014051C3E|nr:hypothetical protein [Lysobacter sp. N42]
MEGKKITTSIKHLAIDLREIERWGSKGKKEEPRAGLELSISQEVTRRGRKGKDSSLYR